MPNKFDNLLQNKFFTTSAIFLITSLIVLFIYFTTIFSGWQPRFYDKLFIPNALSDEIVIIEIDNKSLKEYGRWPWPRALFAEMLEKLQPANPKVIGFDITFLTSEDPNDDQFLADKITEMANVVLATEVVNSNLSKTGIRQAQEIFYPTPVLHEAATAVGFTNIINDSDGVVRSFPLVILDNNQEIIEHFSLKIARQYLNNNVPLVKNDNYYTFSDINIPVNTLSQSLINYQLNPSSFTKVSFTDVLENKIDYKIFDNKIVLIGATAPSLHDLHSTAISKKSGQQSGVEILAHIIYMYLDNAFISEQNLLSTLLLTILLVLSFSILFMYTSRVRYTVLEFILLFIVLLILTFYFFDQGLMINILYFLLGLVLTYALTTLYKYKFADYQKNLVKKMFGKYVSPELAKELMCNPEAIKLGGAKKEVTIFFSDIRGFTSLSEKMTPEELIYMLNQYLTEMTDIVMANKGMVDKYIGDAVMAFWGGLIGLKNHAESSAKASLQMITALEKINQKLKSQNLPEIKIGIGLNTGEVIIGNVGSQQRLNYTVIGDSVNLASRLEGLTKQYGVLIIISEATNIQITNNYLTRYLDLITVKGKEKPVTIYELMDYQKEKPVWLETFSAGIKLYQAQEWEQALEKFNKILLEQPNDGPTKVYIKRCLEYIKKPPANTWDGIYRHTSK